MTGRIWRMALVAVVLVLFAGVVFSADQARDQKRDGTGDGPVQEQLKDGSCQD